MQFNHLKRRDFIALLGSVAVSPLAAQGQEPSYPLRPVHIIVGFPAGGIFDTYARLIGQKLSEQLGQRILIENRPGAGGTIATEAVVRAAPDGYTLLLTGSNDAWNSTLYDNLNYNYIRDIAPVGSISKGMGVLVVHPSFPAKTPSELIAFAKANPSKITIASDGVGSGPHVFWELFRSMTGVDMVHVPYRGAAPALTDLVAGQVQAYFGFMASTLEYIRAGRLRPLAVTSATRADALPDVPTVAEFVPGYDASGYVGIGAPRNTPIEILDKLNTEMNAGLADPKMKERIKELGDTVFASSRPEFGKHIVAFTDKWAKVIRDAHIKL
jgi:tripartite-type tricarboxylate transporter receptor subunit TctC